LNIWIFPQSGQIPHLKKLTLKAGPLKYFKFEGCASCFVILNKRFVGQLTS